MNCTQCGAPLPAKSNICTFCGALNDIDLRAIQSRARKGPHTDRLCPECQENMSTIDIGSGKPFAIERCEKCLGIFFDPGELESLIDQSVSHVYQIDHQRMRALIDEEGVGDFKRVRYVKCPTCHDLMARKSYGYRSGVVADVCRQHGVWLDGGELGQLLKWVKAGGQLHDQRRKEEDERRKRLEQRRKTAQQPGHAALFDKPFDLQSEPGEDVIRGLLGIFRDLMR